MARGNLAAVCKDGRHILGRFMTKAYEDGQKSGASKANNKAAKLIGEAFGFTARTDRKPSENRERAIRKAAKTCNTAARRIGETFGFQARLDATPRKNLKRAIKMARQKFEEIR